MTISSSLVLTHAADPPRSLRTDSPPAQTPFGLSEAVDVLVLATALRQLVLRYSRLFHFCGTAILSLRRCCPIHSVVARLFRVRLRALVQEYRENFRQMEEAYQVLQAERSSLKKRHDE